MSQKTQYPFPRYEVTVNYRKSINELLEKCGHCFVEQDSIKKFRDGHRGSKKIVVFLASFSRNMSTKAVLHSLSELGFRPATIKELLTLAPFLPGSTEIRLISALGSKIKDEQGSVCVSLIASSNNKFDVDSNGIEGDWGAMWYFAAVPK